MKTTGLIACTNRCGSRWLKWVLEDTYSVKVHVERPQAILEREGGIAVGYHVFRMIENLRERYPEIPVLHLVRDPVEMATSMHRQGIATWSAALDLWFTTNLAIIDQERPPWKQMTCEDLWGRKQAIHELATFFGFQETPALDRFFGTRKGIDTPAAVVPPITVSPLIRELAQEFGYLAPDRPEQRFEHVQERRDGRNPREHDGRITYAA